MPKAVIFDVDGTLIDSVDLHAQAWQEAFQVFGRDVPFDDVRQQIGKGGDQLMPVFFSGREIAAFGKELEEYRGELFSRKYMPLVRVFPGVRALFQRIKQDGMKIALASSAKEEELEQYLEMMKVGDLVETKTSSDDAERSKPHPDIYEAALKKLGVDAGDAIMVGDSPYDAQAAGKIGLRTVGLLCGGFSEVELSRAGCHELYRDPQELLQQYERSSLSEAMAA